jgi:hypothetical protein
METPRGRALKTLQTYKEGVCSGNYRTSAYKRKEHTNLEESLRACSAGVNYTLRNALTIKLQTKVNTSQNTYNPDRIIQGTNRAAAELPKKRNKSDT